MGSEQVLSSAGTGKPHGVRGNATEGGSNSTIQGQTTGERADAQFGGTAVARDALPVLQV